MFLLNPVAHLPLAGIGISLHPNMFLLNHLQAIAGKGSTVYFTSQYVSIKSASNHKIDEVSQDFTSQYVSIKSKISDKVDSFSTLFTSQYVSIKSYYAYI